MELIISNSAAEQIKFQLLKRNSPNSYLRVGIKGGGCNGYSYFLQFEDDVPKDKDLVFEKDGVSVVVDSKSIIYLNGSTLEWESTLIRKGFKFINPNIKSMCGCGSSITF